MALAFVTLEINMHVIFLKKIIFTKNMSNYSDLDCFVNFLTHHIQKKSLEFKSIISEFKVALVLYLITKEWF